MDAVTFEGVTKSFGAVAALRGVSFAVREGEVFGLLGPNGAGKTTLMRILLDVIRADSGKVSVFGEPWRVGIEDGQRTWTYGKYRYRLFGQASTQDLVVRFDGQGRVVSYTFNTTEHDQ